MLYNQTKQLFFNDKTFITNFYLKIKQTRNVFKKTNGVRRIKKGTRKSKTEAVLQRRSMLKLGVICKYMKRYGKC